MDITAAQVKELRERTGAGMMACKKALIASQGDIEQAIVDMRKSGAAKAAAKKAGRIASEGIVVCAQQGNEAVLLEVNCETDFVGRNEDFVNFAKQVANAALIAKVGDIEKLASLSLGDAAKQSIEEVRQEIVAKLGENINLRRVTYVAGKGELATYIHSGRIGVIVDVEGGDADLARDIAMHVAANSPVVITPDEVPSALVEKEQDIFRAQAQASGKPAEIIEKMIAGRVKKFVNEVSLLGQAFVRDPAKSVAEILTTAKAKVVQFTRFEVGEGIEKKADDFVAEVMAQARGE